MNLELIVIRVVHILAGVVWAGGAIFMAAVLDPRLRALGPDVHRRVTAALYVPLRVVLEGGGAVTILVGIALVIRMDRLGHLFDTGWGWAITIGLITSVIAHATGVFALTALKKLRGVAEDAEAGRLSDRATLLARLTALLVTVAVVTMAAARFVG